MLAHAGWLEELARRLVGPAGAADLVQDTWVAALERPPRGAGPLGPWLRTVLWRLARDRRQGDAARRARQEGAARDEAQADTLELIARAELHEILIRALLVLAEPYRTVLLLRYFERLSPAEIARRRGVAASTVRTQLERGLARLREQLDARFGGRRDTWCALITDALGPGALGAGAGAFSVGLSSGAIAMKAAVGAVIGAAVVGAVLWGVTGRGGGRAIEPDPGSAAVRGPVERAAAQPDEAPPASAERAPAQAAGRAEAAAVPAAAEAEAAPEAAPPIRILARLTGPEGAVLAGGELALVEPLYAALRATADWRGEALLELERIVRSSQGTLEASAAGHATLRLEVRLEPGAELHLGTLGLGPGGAVEGRVVLPGGAPVAGAELLDAHPARTASVGRDLFGFGSRAEDRIVQAAEDGSFLLEGVPAGPRRVWARSKGHGWTASELLEVPTGGTAGPVLIELAGGQRNLIAGQVVDPEGRPVAGAQIDLRSATTVRPGQRADSQGRFELDVESIPHDLVARDSEGRYGEVVAEGVRPGTVDLVLRLREARQVKLLVRDPAGRPVELFSVTANAVHEQGWTSLFQLPEAERPGGELELRVPGVPFNLVVEAQGRSRAQLGPFGPEEVGERLDVVLALLPGVSGRVLALGEPLAGATVELLRLLPEGRALLIDGLRSAVLSHPEASATSDADGTFQLGLREAGTYLLRARSAGWAGAERAPWRSRPRAARGTSSSSCCAAAPSRDA